MYAHTSFGTELVTLSKEQWLENHDLVLPDPERKQVSVTQFIEYLGVGYGCPWKLGREAKKEDNPYLKKILDWGRRVETRARDFFLLYSRAGSRVQEVIFTEERDETVFQYQLEMNKNKLPGRVLTGTPDLVFIEDEDTIAIVEFKCPWAGVSGWNLKHQWEMISGTYHDPKNLEMGRGYASWKKGKYHRHELQLYLYMILEYGRGQYKKVKGYLCYHYLDLMNALEAMVIYEIPEIEPRQPVLPFPDAFDDFFTNFVGTDEPLAVRGTGVYSFKTRGKDSYYNPSHGHNFTGIKRVQLIEPKEADTKEIWSCILDPS